MKSRHAWRLVPLVLPLGSALLLVSSSGCGDGTVRGAGSIDVPKPAKFEPPTRSAKATRTTGASQTPHAR
ncbi:hypothetical protein [Aquisphaera insulae]|uniref:hypothetical protein n=1 Tax=Aquisphaera insulae TaxID=2712864 RepID=UPI0013EBA570|nr:hypothetical protein [Aquisphaera insulae]